MGFSLDRLTGENVEVNGRRMSVTRQLGEGGFAFVYLAKVKVKSSRSRPNNQSHSRGRNVSLGRRVLRSLSRTRGQGASLDYNEQVKMGDEQDDFDYEKGGGGSAHHSQSSPGGCIVLKTASAATPERRAQSENELHYLRMLGGHPNIVDLIDCSFQMLNHSSVCFMLLRYCEGGSLMDVVQQTLSTSSDIKGYEFSNASTTYLSTFEIVEYFSQLSEAVHYLHTFHDDEDETVGTLGGESVNITVASDVLYGKAVVSSTSKKIHARSSPYKASSIFRRVGQHYRNPIVHRDLKLENVLLKKDVSMPTGFRCQLCDFGSAIEGRVDLRSAEDRRRHGEIIRSSTTQMYRAPEMVDLHLVPELTERTDIWSIGCCLYTLCFLKNCFEENSNLAILTGEYDIPQSHPFPREIIELMSRMICMDPNQRASIDEVLECLDAIKNKEALPTRVSNGSRRTIQGRGLSENQIHKQQTSEYGMRMERSTQAMDSKHLNEDSQLQERCNENYPNPTALTRQLSATKLNPNSAAAKRLQSNQPKQSNLISPSNIALAFPVKSENGPKSNKQASSRRISPKVHPKQIQSNDTHSRKSNRSESPRVMERNIQHEGNNTGWANFQSLEKVTHRSGSQRQVKNNEIFDERPVDNWGFAAFDDGQQCGFHRNDSNGRNEFEEYFSNESCGFPNFRSSPVGQCSTSLSQSQEDLSLDFSKNHPFGINDNGGVDGFGSPRLIEKLKLGGVAKAFLSNARFAFTSCNSNTQSAS